MGSVDYGWAHPVVRRLCEASTHNIALCLSSDPSTRLYVLLAIRGWEARAKELPFDRFADRVAIDSRRSLLADLWGRDLGSLKLLARCSRSHWSRGQVDALAAALTDQESRRYLGRQRKITRKTLDLLRHAKAGDGLIRRADAYAHLAPSTADYLIEALLHRNPALNEEAVVRAIGKARYRHQIKDAVHELLIDVKLPPPSWLGSDSVFLLRSLRAIRQTGQLFANCLIDCDYALQALAGGISFYVAEVEGRHYCISLKRDRVLQAWRVNEIKGVGNRKPTPRHRKIIINQFAEAGFPDVKQGLDLWFD